MFLGQDFGTEIQYNNINESGDNEQKNPTWRNMLKFIKSLGIKPEECFFTNSIMGVRKDGNSLGKSPATKDPEFMKECYNFFKIQISSLNTKAVFVMGKETANFVWNVYESNTADIDDWKIIKDVKALFETGKFCKTIDGIKFIYLTHPSLRPTNVSQRWRPKDNKEWKLTPENDRELELTINALKI